MRRVPPGVGIFAGFLIAMGVLHFVAPRPFDSIMPRSLPESAHRPLTYASGAAEIACGAMLLAPRTRALGARLTALLMLAVWPANIEAALRGGYPAEGFLGSATAAWLRVPLQLPLIAWALLIGRRADRAAADRAAADRAAGEPEVARP